MNPELLYYIRPVKFDGPDADKEPLGDLLATMRATRERSRQSMDRLAQCDPRALRFKHFSLGEMDGADEAKVREAVAALAPGVELRAVEVRRSHSFLEVAPEALDGVVTALNGKDWNGKALTAEKARRRRR